MTLATDERLDRIEAALEQFIAQTNTQMAQVNMALDRLERMSEQSNARIERAYQQAEKERLELARMIEQTNARAERDRQQAERNRQEAEKDRLEARQERRALARQLGDISNRLGTIVEDMIAPSLRRMAREELDCGEIQLFGLRLEKYHPVSRQRREFDVIVVGTQAVLFNQTKATARPEYAKEFVEVLQRGEFFDYFPEYAGKPLIPVFSSLYMPDDIVTYLTSQNVYAVAMGDETMQVLNLDQVRRRA